MTNTVTPETGRLLAAAGFPQPIPAPGQWWGNRHGLVYVYGEKNGMYTPVIHFIPGGRPWVDDYFDASDFTGLVYLPTATDIMEHLGVEYVLWYDDSPKMLKWLCARTGNTYHEAGKPFLGPTAAEAAALAYLSIHEKSKT